MPVHKDKAKGQFIFEFDRYIQGQRIRARKLLPRAWTRAQADAFDREESARLYAEATNIQRASYTIEEAVAGYLKGRVPKLKHGHEIAAELALIFWAYEGRDLTELAEVCREYTAKAGDLKPATIKKRIRYLSAACRWSWKNLDMGTEDPAARVVVPSVKNARQVYIGRAQMVPGRPATRMNPRPTVVPSSPWLAWIPPSWAKNPTPVVHRMRSRWPGSLG